MSAAVIQALSKVMAELPAIGKGDKSPEGYSYRGIEAITKHLQPLLARHGVIIVPSANVTQVVPSPEMKPGWQDVYVTVDWEIFGPDGTSIVSRTNGIGRDRADKGANKAQTQAFKYLLLHLLSIADKADDADGLTYEQDRVVRQVPPDPRPEPESIAPEREAAIVVYNTIRNLDAEQRGTFEEWRIDHHGSLTVNNLTTDQEWCAEVSVFLRELGALA